MADSSFRGVNVLLSVLRELVDRPGWRPRRGSGDRPLPLVCRIDDTGGNEVLTALDGRLKRAERHKVPFVLVDVAKAAERARTRWTEVNREGRRSSASSARD